MAWARAAAWFKTRFKYSELFFQVMCWFSIVMRTDDYLIIKRREVILGKLRIFHKILNLLAN